MSMAKIINFPIIGDDRGSLISIEPGFNKNVPFEVKRIYYIFGTKPGVSRGFHAHKKLKQVAIAISGSCQMLLKNGIDQEIIDLNSPNLGLLIEGMTWREMHNFSADCVLMVLASEAYDESDYIRDYDVFLSQVKR